MKKAMEGVRRRETRVMRRRVRAYGEVDAAVVLCALQVWARLVAREQPPVAGIAAVLGRKLLDGAGQPPVRDALRRSRGRVANVEVFVDDAAPGFVKVALPEAAKAPNDTCHGQQATVA